MVNFAKPTDLLLEKMTLNLRESDIKEVKASHDYTPREALIRCWNNSDFCTMVVDTGEPFVFVGISVVNVSTGLGASWMLSTNGIYKNKEYFLDNAPNVITEMLSICPRLVNYVHHENVKSIRWLSSLGFTIEDPVPYGVSGDLFHKFHMEVNNVHC